MVKGGIFMNIKRYKKNIITRNIRKEKTITEQINQVGGVNMNARIQELQKKLSLNIAWTILF
jgi:hypothetical protein